MAAPIYCTHKELKRVFPQLDSFDNKKPVYGWTEVSSNKYAAHNSGLVTQCFADGEDLGPAQSAHTDLNVEGEWFYNSAEDVLYYFSATNPNDKLMEAGEEFTAMVTQYRTDASRYLDSMLDPNMPKEAWKDKTGAYDYIIIRTTALIAANFMIKAHDPNSELANALMEEANQNIENINQGKAALSWQVTRDSAQGVVRDVVYNTAGAIRPVDTRGEWHGTYDLIKVIITVGGALGTAKYEVYTKDSTKLKNQLAQSATVISGDYQPLAGGLEIRFAGSSNAIADDEWEIECFGKYEDVDASSGKSVKMTRTRKTSYRRYETE
jgi:hypothetical protein|tara:strand:+ start:735 stop:1703 length:969 start_codon:yes stop_codon:yes gene_type:complete